MVRLFSLCLACALLSFGAAVPAQDTLQVAEADLRQSQARAAALEQRANRLNDRMARLRGRQQAAVAQIDAAEAQITLSSIAVNRAETRATEIRRQLVEARRPASMFLAGLASLSRRPPVLTLIEARDADTLVHTKLLFDSTMPSIRRRTLILEREAVAASSALAEARRARSELTVSRAALKTRERQLQDLERLVEREALKAGEAAVGAGDEALRAAEFTADLRRSDAADRSMADAAGALAALEAFPGRATSGSLVSFGPKGYRLPASESVSAGLGSLDRSGVRARGLTMDVRTGAEVVAPATGKVLFAGPYRDLAGVIIIDHGSGWISVVTNVGPQVRKGERVAAGVRMARALGPIGIELSRGGIHYSPALIAGSSEALSNAPVRR